MDAERAEELLRRGSAILPSVILAKLIGTTQKALQKRRTVLGITQSMSDGKRITKTFLAKLPEFGDLPLTADERRLVRTLRQEWIYRKKGDLAAIDNIYDVIIRSIRRIPTLGIAAALGMSSEMIVSYQKELELQLGRPERRAIEHRYASSPKCPMPSFLSADERCRLKEHWRAARARYKAARARAREKSMAVLERNLARLEVLKAGLVAANPQIELRPCSGTCRRAWPRAKAFFIPNFRSPDKLGERCKYCDLAHRVKVRHDGTRRKNRKRGRILTAAAEARAKEVFEKYCRLIPPPIIAQLFNVGPSTIERYRHELGITIERSDYHRIFWRWYFREEMPPLEFLTEEELTKLYLVTTAWRKIVGKRFARSEELEKTLQEERVLARAQAWHGPETEPVAEVKCIRCGAEYPPTPVFFRFVGKKERPVCRVCVDFKLAVTRMKLMRRRYKRT